ncbi:MAG TPA: MucR family transcriptional regulator [Stellaceae bacterium]|nr:MucR family transcriptional regulator [Stellaceae bacterium]
MAELVVNKAAPARVLRMTTTVVAAYLRKHPLPSAQIADIIATVYGSLKRLESGEVGSAGAETQRPAVPVRRSIHADYLVCLEDGKKLKMLKRHLRTTYNLTPEQYRQKWGLPPDYPMVAPNYADQRSAFAKKIGLGRAGTRRVPVPIRK